jgi:hypothetical protein
MPLIPLVCSKSLVICIADVGVATDAVPKDLTGTETAALLLLMELVTVWLPTTIIRIAYSIIINSK